MSTCRDGICPGGDRRAKRLLHKEKEVSTKDHLVTAKNKTKKDVEHEKRAQRDKRGGDEDNRANLHHGAAKNKGDKRKIAKIIVARHSHIPTTTNSSRTTRNSPEHPHNYAGGAWRYRARADIVRGRIEAIVMKREMRCELSRPSAYAPILSSDVYRASDGQRRGKVRGIQRTRIRVDTGKTKTPISGNACLAFSLPLLRPLAAGSEFQRDLGASHEEVQYAEHVARNSKSKGTKPGRDACAAGRAR
jgi:hypothetical protein